MRRRPRVLSSTERRVLTMLYATEEATRRESCAEIADRLGIENVRTVHEVAEAALKKICYEPKKLRRR